MKRGQLTLLGCLATNLLLLMVETGWSQCPERQKFRVDSGTNFGRSVSVDGDVVAIGGGRNSGWVDVYRLDNATNMWLHDQTLTPSDGEFSFGRSLAVDNDIIVVGAPYDDDRGTNAGAVYIFCYDPIFGWNEHSKLTATSDATPEEDLFGWSVSVSGDVVAVGARQDEDGGGTGSVNVFRFDGSLPPGVWNHEAEFLGGPQDLFGNSVSLDLSDNSVLAVGAPSQSDPGSVVVFRFNGSTWDGEAVTAADGSLGDQFGFSVSTYDGFLLVGAPGDDEDAVGGTHDVGSAYMFRYDATRPPGMTWVLHQGKLRANDWVGFDYYGTSVALSDKAAVVGAPNHDIGDPDTGGAYAYRFDGSSWGSEIPLAASDRAANDEFGGAVSASRGRVIVGASLDDDPVRDRGSAYMFHLDELTLSIEPTTVTTGTMMDFATYCGAPGGPAGLIVVAINGGGPLFLPVFIGSFNQFSCFCISSVPVPPGISNTVVTFQTVGLGICPGLLQSNVVDVTFQ